MKKTLIYLMTIVIFGSVISGCFKKEAKTAGAIDLLSGMRTGTEPTPTPEPLVDNKTPRGNPETKDATYVLLKDPVQLVSQEVVLMPPPLNYDRIAKALSLKYVRTDDTFKKKDILASLKPKIDELLKEAGENHYMILSSKPYFENYDFNKKSFQLSTFNEDRTFGYSNDGNMDNRASIDFSNKKKFNLLKVEDEAVAREIEDLRSASNFNDNSMKTFIFIQKTHQLSDNTSPFLVAEIMKVQILGKKGNIIFEQK